MYEGYQVSRGWMRCHGILSGILWHLMVSRVVSHVPVPSGHSVRRLGQFSRSEDSRAMPTADDNLNEARSQGGSGSGGLLLAPLILTHTCTQLASSTPRNIDKINPLRA